MIRFFLILMMIGTLAGVSACGKRGAPARPSDVTISAGIDAS